MLTSRARETLRDVETVIVDEIHALAGSKRGAHLFLNLERLEATVHAPFQRVGLSATQRPLSEIARLLGGYRFAADGACVARDVTILDVASPRPVELRVEMPSTAGSQETTSAWTSIHPRILELVRQHRSTMVFVNNRSLAERLAGALNELAGEELVLAHHGSIAKERRMMIEDRLKRGDLRAVVTTSSLELGIDVGAVDLVVQIEAPISIASGIQRVGRAGHQVGGTSRGVLFPKFKADLVASAAAAKQMLARHVEETKPPKNPLDVLAQVIVAEVAGGPVTADDLFVLVRRAAPFVELSRASFDGVLDMLSGRYPSERFRELRARVVWDRKAGVLAPRRGTRMLAVQSGGTIPDRGLFGVYLSGAEPALKLGELDEEMVFESRVGEVFLLGASSWRIDGISHDRVLVTPAPGEPGKMPFWRGAGFGRSLELGVEIGRLLALLEGSDPERAVSLLQEQHRLTQVAAEALVGYVQEQQAVAAVPTDRRVVVEYFVDEGGDVRVVILTPFGGRVHAPWLLLVIDRLREEYGSDVDATLLDDGKVYRLPASDRLPLLEWFLPDPDSARATVEAELGHTALFAARFRENAARALLLPRRAVGRRTPLWVQAR
jgi:ATP-dependent Lhr-like helicase